MFLCHWGEDGDDTMIADTLLSGYFLKVEV